VCNNLSDWLAGNYYPNAIVGNGTKCKFKSFTVASDAWVFRDWFESHDTL
jgi:hypothetical protein